MPIPRDIAFSTVLNWKARYVWPRTLSAEDVEHWLENFPRDERDTMRFLAAHLVLYEVDDLRSLVRLAFQRYWLRDAIDDLHLSEPKDGPDIRRLARERIVKTEAIIPLGNPSRSGSLTCYFLRQEANLEDRVFFYGLDLIHSIGDEAPRVQTGDRKAGVSAKTLRRITFVDDFSISGSQFCGTERERASRGRSGHCELRIQPLLELLRERVAAKIEDLKVRVLFLFATKAALQRVREKLSSISPTIRSSVETIVSLDERAQVTGGLLTVDNEGIAAEQRGDSFRERVVDVAVRHGERLYPREESGEGPLGFGDGALAMSLPFNMPNNNLPVFWVTKDKDGLSWRPLIRRHAGHFSEVRRHDH